MLLRLLLSILIPAAGWADELSCEQKHIRLTGEAAVCGAWKNQGVLLQSFEDGSVLPNPSKIRDEQNQLPQEIRTRAARLNPNTQHTNQMMREFNALKSTALQQAQGEAGPNPYLRDRLGQLQIVWADANHPSCLAGPRDPGPLNAYFDQVANVIGVCPLFSHMPVEAVLPLVAHELAHVFDPCNFTETYRFSDELGNSLKQGAPQFRQRLSQCLQDFPIASRREFAQWASSANRMDRYEFSNYVFADERRRMLERLAQCNLVDAPAVRPPRTYADHPYLSTLTCVNRTHPRAQDVAGDTSKNGMDLPYQHPVPITPSTPVPAEGPTCATERSQRTSPNKEATADYIGAQIFATHIRQNPSRFPVSRRAYFTYFQQAVHCEQAAEESGNRLHLGSADRLRILLQIPEVAQASGCTVPPLQGLCPLESTAAPTSRQTPSQR